LQQVAVKAALSEIPPLFQGGIRSLGATILVYGWARVRGIALFGRDRTFGPGLLAGLLFALEFLFIYMSLPHTNASRLVVFLYLAPFVVALLLPRFEPAERLRKIQLVGLVCAFLALAYAFQEGFGLTSREQLWGDFLAVSAAVMWGLTTLTIRATRLATAAPEKTLFYQLAVSAVFLLIASRVRGEIWPVHISTLGIASLLFQTVAVAFVSYLAWFWLLRHYSATKISAFSFLTPIFGLMFGALILGETIGIRLVLALTFVTLGVFLVNRKTSARVGKSAQ
jgi:drug/metabolite transporter (DMT)-like permease